MLRADVSSIVQSIGGIGRALRLGSMACFAAICGLLLVACAPSPPNLLLVTLDTTRADRLGCYGYLGAQTPILDSLATAGVRFVSAFSPVPLTLPAHSTMMTGVQPWEHGVHDNGFYQLDKSWPTIAGILSEHDYWCGAVIGAYPLIRQYGLGRGFHSFDDEMPITTDGVLYPERKAPDVTEAALSMISTRDRSKPLFLWVHYFDPHVPYRQNFPDISAYDSEIALVDRELGRLLRQLPDGPWVVIAVGDHGEGLGDHGEADHGNMLYDSTLRIPLIIAGPGWPAGSVRNDPVILVDLAPTLLLCAGVPQGIFSGFPLQSAKESRRIQAETLHPLLRFGWSPLRAVRYGPSKLIVGGSTELFDISRDPGEHQNLATQEPALVMELSKELPPQSESGQTSALSFRDRQALAALGYVDEPDGTPATRDSLIAWIDQGYQLLYYRQYSKAESILRRVIRYDPGNLRALHGIGATQLRRELLRLADSTYTAIHDRYPTYLPATQSLASIRFRLDDIDGAKRFSLEVLERLPDDPDALLWLAVIENRREHYQESLEYYESYVRVKPNHASVLMDIGILLAYRLNDKQSAAPYFRRAIEADPSLPDREEIKKILESWG